MSPACPPLCQQQGLGASSMAFWRREGWEAPTFLPLPPMQHPGGGERVGGRTGTLHPWWLLMLGRGGGTPEPCGAHGGGIVQLRLLRSHAGGRGRGFTKGCRRSQHQLGAACGEQGSALRLGLGAGRRNSFALPLGDTARAPSKAQSIPGWFPPGPASPHPSQPQAVPSNSPFPIFPPRSPVQGQHPLQNSCFQHRPAALTPSP